MPIKIGETLYYEWVVCLFHSYYSVATLSSEGKRSPCCCIASRVYRSRLGDRHIKIRRQYCWSSNSRAQHSEATKQDDVPRETLIWRAIKLPIYSVALVPITVRHWLCLWFKVYSAIALVFQNEIRKNSHQTAYWISSLVSSYLMRVSMSQFGEINLVTSNKFLSWHIDIKPVKHPV